MNGDLRVPDVVVTRMRPTLKLGRLIEVPMYAFEVLAEQEPIVSLFYKCQFYLDAGVQGTYVVDPHSKQLWKYTPHKVILKSGNVCALPGIEGFAVETSRLFED